jgi:hypothetical protein
MITTVEVERFSLTSSRPFDKILAAIKAAVGHPDMVEFAKTTAAARTFPQFESTVREGLGKSGLMLFMELDHGSVIRKATGGDKPRMARLIMGNPLIMQQMQGTFRTQAPMLPSRYSSTNALTASTSPTTGWSVCWLPIGIPTRSRSRGISTRKSRPFCRKRQVEPTSLRRQCRAGRLRAAKVLEIHPSTVARRIDDQSIAVGSFCQRPDSGGH